MKTPRRPEYYDVTTNAREGDSPPPPTLTTPRRSLGASLRDGLGAAWLWVRRPAVLAVPLVLGLGLAVKVVAERFRPPTIDGPALPRAGWRASGYPDYVPPGAALDGDPQTEWRTGRGQRTSDWFAVDMRKPRTFHQVVLDTGAEADDYPRGFAVYVSSDGVHWGTAVATGEGRAPLTIIDLGPRTARSVKVVLTNPFGGRPWSLSEFTVH